MKRFGGQVMTAMVLLSVVAMSTACYGPFALTKNVYRWNSNIKGNGEVNDKWMKELVFFGLIIVPAYQFSALLDMFIFNSMHFWTGESPIKESGVEHGHTRVAMMGDTAVRWTPSNDGATVTFERQGVVERRAMILSTAMGYRLVDERGILLSEAEYGADGGIRFLNAECQVVHRVSQAQVLASAGVGR